MEIKVEGNNLVIKTPLSSGVPSRSRKTLVVASTNGFVDVVDSNIRVSLNVIKPKG